MKTIGIDDFKSLVKNCLENPASYADKTIVLWNADHMQYGIAYRIIEECCIEYNKKSTNNQVWYKYSDFTFKKDEITNIKVCPDISWVHTDMYGFKTRGILFNTGCFMNKELNEWLEFVNTRKNESGLLSNDWVLIACAHQADYNLKESDFSDNCAIYSIQPSVEEWANWVAKYNSAAVVIPIRAYIDEKNPSISLDIWNRVLNVLDDLVNSKESARELKQISKKDYDLNMKGSLSFIYNDFPFEALWDFIQLH